MAKRKSVPKSKRRSNRASQNKIPSTEGERLVRIWSKRARVILDQYDSHDLHLGKTKQTPSGRLCESLIRDEIKRVLPPGLAAEFGYIFGAPNSSILR